MRHAAVKSHGDEERNPVLRTLRPNLAGAAIPGREHRDDGIDLQRVFAGYEFEPEMRSGGPTFTKQSPPDLSSQHRLSAKLAEDLLWEPLIAVFQDVAGLRAARHALVAEVGSPSRSLLRL